MIIIPKNNPVINNLNSYYLNIKRLLEHYQGDLGTGYIYFKSPATEGAVYFDEDHLLNGVYEEKKRKLLGQEAVDMLVKNVLTNNYLVSVYFVEHERLYYWANLSYAIDLYNDLSTEFTDILGLIKKMNTEKLTGYIEVSLKNVKYPGVIFFINGEIFANVPFNSSGDLDTTDKSLKFLINQCTKSRGFFNVKKISMDNPEYPVISYSETNSSKITKTPTTTSSDDSTVKQKIKQVDDQILDMACKLLVIFEKCVNKNRKIKNDFDTLMRKKFLEKIDKYDFLDPFDSDFHYSKGTIKFTGNVKAAIFITGITECIKEISEEYGMVKQFKKYIKPWRDEYSDDLDLYGIEF